MAYTFKGRLCGFICSECPEPLANIVVRLYRSREGQNVTALAVANPKDTFAILTDEAVKEKASALIAETETDEQGNFTFELGEQQQYNGEAFEIDGYCGTLPHHKVGPNPHPVQFSITTLQPQWRQTESGAIAAWEYCLPYRFWCAILALFGAWTICGRVTTCDTKIPVAGVKVRAFDADWLQDDELGSAITDAAGKFRIDYTTLDFQKTIFSPLINLEWVGGPDLYFRIETPSGTVLMNEGQARGRQPDRENAGHCFCVELCLDKPPNGGVDTPPLFTNVGAYRVDPIYGDFTADGLTSAGNYAFTDTIPLMGILPDGASTDAVEYHFQIGTYNSAGTALVSTVDVDAGMISPTAIGKLEYYRFDGTSWILTSADYYVNNPGVAPIVISATVTVTPNVTVKPQGWIEVPRENELWPGGKGRFVPYSGGLINLDTTVFTNESFDLTTPAPALKAGESVPAAKKGSKPTYKLFFEARKVVGGTSVSSNALEKIAFSNTHYTQLRHPDWNGGVSTHRAAVMLDIAEFVGPGATGCDKLANHLHALYTAYHPYLGEVVVYFEGNPPLPATLTLAPAGGEVTSGPAGHDYNISTLQPCAYIIWLRATLNLTSGWGRISDEAEGRIWDHIAFCKS